MFELAINGGRARLTLNRPQARNAIPLDGWGQLAAAVEEAEASGAALLILAGTGGSFCAGADILDFKGFKGDTEAVARFRSAMRLGLERLAGCRIPTIAAIDGPCYGAGVALAIACDIRLAGSAAVFAITPAKFGISYPQADIHRLVNLIGPSQAARLLFTASAIDASEAERIGLVEQSCEDSGAEAEMLANAIGQNSSDSLATLKRGIRLAAEGVASDETQDARFVALLASDALADRLEERRGRR
jgi:enoyl-CoA hydratase/carnithine racemase